MQKRLTVGDLPFFKPVGKKRPSFVALLYPHENEQLAVQSVGSALTPVLKVKGSEVVSVITGGMMDRGRRMREAIPDEDNVMLVGPTATSLLALEDICLRIANACQIFRECGKGAYVLELHAMRERSKDALLGGYADDPMYQIRGSEFVIMELMKHAYIVINDNHPLKNRDIYWELVSDSSEVRKEQWKYMLELGKQYGFDLEGELSKLKDNLSFLQHFEKDAYLLEIPAKRHEITVGSKNYGYYSRSDGKGGFEIHAPLEFESLYCTQYFVDAKFTNQDLEILASLIKSNAISTVFYGDLAYLNKLR